VTERALMTIDDVIEDFGATGHTLPRASMQWALDNWALAAPRFLELLSRYVDGIDTSKSTADALFFIVHLLGEKAETGAFVDLCRLSRGKGARAVLGDRARPPPDPPRDVDTYGMADTIHHIGAWMSFMAQPKIPNDMLPWIEARKRFRLSHAQIQMARELGLNPKQFGKLDNHHQEPWKQPLPEFIASLYEKRFGTRMPAVVTSIEEVAAAQQKKKQERKAKRAAARAQAARLAPAVPPD
jgi:hypothetical protein